MMEAIRVFLADLTHTGTCIATDTMPLNIALIASYAQKRLGSRVTFSLFKYPEDLLDSLRKETPHILGASNYAWNHNLSEWACRAAKRAHPQVLTVRGGWNFPLTSEEQLEFLQRSPHTDIYVRHEGETGFFEVLNRFLMGGREGVLAAPVPGCVYLQNLAGQRRLISGEVLPHLKRLDDIPSPYLAGMLDHFFDGKLTPIIETTRGCPFSCNYCNSATSYHSKIRAFSDGYVMGELEYIAGKMIRYPAGGLTIADTNFGMYPRDERIATKINQIADSVGWPRFIGLTTGKNRLNNVLAALRPLGKLMVPTISFQSLHPATVSEIGRANVSAEEFHHLAKRATDCGMSSFSELIVPLPYETLETYWLGVRTLLNNGASRIISYTLQANHGTVYRQTEYQQKHGYTIKVRLVPNDFGIYNGEFVFEPEAVGVATKYLSFEDYLDIRRFTLYLDIVYNNNIFLEVLKLLREKGITAYDFLMVIKNSLPMAPSSIRQVVRSFEEETKSELMDTEEDLQHFYSAEENYGRLVGGEIGGNVVFKHKARVLTEHVQDLVHYVVDCARTVLEEKGDDDPGRAHMLDCLEQYLTCKLYDLFDDSSVDDVVVYVGDYNFYSWLNDPHERKLACFRRETELAFSYSEEQKKLKRTNADHYGRHVVGRTRILARLTTLENMYRVPHTKND